MTTQSARSRAIFQHPGTIAAIAAAGSAAVALSFFPVVSTVGYAWAITVCLTGGAAFVAVVDARTHKLPNRYVSALASAGLIQAAAVAVDSHDPTRFLDSVLAAAAVGAVYVLLGLLGWFGFGDAKFAASLTVTVGIYAGLAAMYVAPLASVFAAIWVLILRATGNRAAARAHGPALALSAVCVMVLAVLAWSTSP